MVVQGKIVKVRGNRGELLCGFSTGLPQYEGLIGETAVLRSDRYEKQSIIESIRSQGERFLVKFSGVDSIEEAYSLVGYDIRLTLPDELAAAMHIADYVGYSVEDTDGNRWGTVARLDDTAMNPLLEIIDDDERILVPFVPEIIRRINEEEKRIVIDPPDGLRELNQ